MTQLLTTVTVALQAAADAATTVLAVVDPGQGTAPPGSGGITTIISWIAWVVFAVCVVGVLIVAGAMALAHRRGEGGQHAANLGWVLGGAILAGSASAVIGALL